MSHKKHIVTTKVYEQVLAVLEAAGVTYIDCNGRRVGDCSTCPPAASGGGSGSTSNTISFNPITNVLSSVVNGVGSTTELAFTSGDVVTTGTIVVNGVSYPAGTTLQAIVSALSAATHAPVTVLDSSEIDFILVGQQISAKLKQQGASVGDALVWDGFSFVPGGAIAGMPPGGLGAQLFHNGTDWQACYYTQDVQTGLTGTTVTLGGVPLAFCPKHVYRNGQFQIPIIDYTILGNVLTFNSPIDLETSTVIASFYYL